MNTNQIHETVIRDIVDIISDVKDSDEVQLMLNRGKSIKSVAQASANLTLVFPVLTSTNLSIDNASMVTKAIERKASTMLQMLFTAMTISDVDNGIDFIKNFHTNLKLDGKVTVDQFLNAFEKVNALGESSIRISNMEIFNAVKKDLQNIDYTLPSDISENSVGDFKIYPQSRFGNTMIIKEDSYKPNHEKISSIQSGLKNGMEMIAKQILPTDIQKANELVPTMMVVNFISTTTGEAIPSQLVIGIKAKMYPIDSMDIINRIKIKNEDNNGILKFIKATTREISFFKDFVFAIDKAKIDALSQSKRGSSSKMWKVLERRSLKSKLRRTLGTKNDASAITTLVISQEEVEYLKKQDNIDISTPNTIRPIMEAYNLMGVCIVDESVEVATFLFDTGDDIYESISFSHLEREQKDGSSKKVLNLMTKMAR